MFSPRNNSDSTINLNSIVSKYHVTFAGATIETTVTDKSSVAAEWVAEITAFHAGKHAVIGLDVEWWPLPIPHNKPATLQLCSDKKCLILQLFYMDQIPNALKAFLLNPNFAFVGTEIHDDVLKLKNHYELDCTRIVDIKAAVDRRWPGRFGRPGLKNLAMEVCGLNMKKPTDVCMSDWEARVLSDAQVEYACIDAYASYKIGHKVIIYGALG